MVCVYFIDGTLGLRPRELHCIKILFYESTKWRLLKETVFFACFGMHQPPFKIIDFSSVNGSPTLRTQLQRNCVSPYFNLSMSEHLTNTKCALELLSIHLINVNLKKFLQIRTHTKEKPS